MAHFPDTILFFASGHILLLSGYDPDKDGQAIFFFFFTSVGISSKIRHIVFDGARKQQRNEEQMLTVDFQLVHSPSAGNLRSLSLRLQFPFQPIR